MKKMKKIIVILAAVMLLVFLCFLPSLLACEHKNISSVDASLATCTKNGIKNEVCNDCGIVLNQSVIDAYGHSFGEYVLTRDPILENKGVEMRTCNNCGFFEYKGFDCSHGSFKERVLVAPTCGEEGIVQKTCAVCGSVWTEAIDMIPHVETYSTVIKDPSCYEEGIEIEICMECGGVAEEHCLEKIDCSYADWVYSVYATPFDDGERYQVCVICGNKNVEKYSFEMENNTLYIPTAGIYCKLTIGEFTQSDVDNNDVVYTTGAYGVRDSSNPFILGHWYGSLIDMHKTKVGEKVYVCIDGQIDTYEVLISEYAVEINRTYHIGQISGVNIWDTYGSAMNSNLAWYGRNHYGIDRWENINDGKTVHMYTCHNGNEKEGWLPEHGGSGRWIVVGNLINSQVVDFEN